MKKARKSQQVFKTDLSFEEAVKLALNTKPDKTKVKPVTDTSNFTLGNRIKKETNRQ